MVHVASAQADLGLQQRDHKSQPFPTQAGVEEPRPGVEGGRWTDISSG